MTFRHDLTVRPGFATGKYIKNTAMSFVILRVNSHVVITQNNVLIAVEAFAATGA
jgi:hypothetical protein